MRSFIWFEVYVFLSVWKRKKIFFLKFSGYIKHSEVSTKVLFSMADLCNRECLFVKCRY